MNKRNVSLFLDSGAHSLYTKHVIDKGHQNGYSYYESEEFWNFVDDYAAFINKWKDYLDIYVSVDVIFEPALSWRVQKYMEEKHKLSPLPVFHFGEDLKWLKKYMKHYEYIGIGGLGQEVTKSQYYAFGDAVFSLICPGNTKLPIVKTHGFAMTSIDLLLRYPWYSVDSTTWSKIAMYGAIYIPRKKNGRYKYTTPPHTIFLSNKSGKQKEIHQHITTVSERERKEILDYVAFMGYEFGTDDEEGNPIVHGVSNSHKLREEINMKFFLDLQEHMPPWPQPFVRKSNEGFNLLGDNLDESQLKRRFDKHLSMKIYFAGAYNRQLEKRRGDTNRILEIHEERGLPINRLYSFFYANYIEGTEIFDLMDKGAKNESKKKTTRRHTTKS